MEKQIQQLENLRGVVGDYWLNSVIDNVKRRIQNGFAEVFLTISHSQEKEAEGGYFITVLTSSQGSLTIDEFFKDSGEDEKHYRISLTPTMVHWADQARRKYEKFNREDLIDL